MNSTKTRIYWKRLFFAVGLVAVAVFAAPRAPGWAAEWKEASAKSDEQEVIEDLCRLRTDVDLFVKEMGRFPKDWSELKTEVPLDPWGNPYRLTLRQPSGHLAIETWGADGLRGGHGPNADWSDFEAKFLRD